MIVSTLVTLHLFALRQLYPEQTDFSSSVYGGLEDDFGQDSTSPFTCKDATVSVSGEIAQRNVATKENNVTHIELLELLQCVYGIYLSLLKYE